MTFYFPSIPSYLSATMPPILLCLFLSLLNTKHVSGFTETLPDSVSRAEFIQQRIRKADTLNAKGLSVATRTENDEDLNNALLFVMQGLHIYSSVKDSFGLTQSFDNLGFIYCKQKKYSQAKWFILQSNSLSRLRKDTIQIIHSLICLAEVKTAIHDQKLALGDLNEVYHLVSSNRSDARKNLLLNDIASFYRERGDSLMAQTASKKIKYLIDSAAKERKREALLKSTMQLQQNKVASAVSTTAAKKGVVPANGIASTALTITVITLATVLLLVVLIIQNTRTKKQRP